MVFSPPVFGDAMVPVNGDALASLNIDTSTTSDPPDAGITTEVASVARDMTEYAA